MALAEGMTGQTLQHLEAFLDSDAAALATVESARLWRHPEYSLGLLQLIRRGGHEAGSAFFLLSPQGTEALQIPPRYNRYPHRTGAVIRVSDLDQDQAPEIWFAEDEDQARDFDRCAGDETDLLRDPDCWSNEVDAIMGEVQGGVLTYFRDAWAGMPGSRGDMVSAAPAPGFRYLSQDGPCNAMRVGALLGPVLGISDWSHSAGVGGLHVVSLRCRAHPVQPDHTLVALFHEIPAGRIADPAAVTDPVGFVVAVLDLRRGKLLRSYQSQMEEDATTRIRPYGGLAIELATILSGPICSPWVSAWTSVGVPQELMAGLAII